MIEDCLSIIPSFIYEVAFKIILKRNTSIIHILMLITNLENWKLPFAYFRNIDFTLLEKLKRLVWKAWILTMTLFILFPFSLPFKKRGKKKKRMIGKNRDKNLCLSDRLLKSYFGMFNSVSKTLIKYLLN